MLEDEEEKPVVKPDDDPGDNPQGTKAPEEKADFSWKKNGFDIREHLTLKNNALEATFFQQKQSKDRPKTRMKPTQNLPLGLMMLKKKVREVYDEEEDEEDYMYNAFPMFQMRQEEDDGRLAQGLSENEKLMLKQKETIETVKALQTAGKMEALHVAHNLAREAGFKGLSEKTVAESMQEAVFKPEKIQEKAIQKDVSKKLGIKGKLKDGQIIQAARGIKKVENLGGQKAAKNLDMKDVIKAGEEKLDEIKLAELILQKSGQDVKKRKHKLNESKEKMELKYLGGGKNKDVKDKSPDIAALKQKDVDFSR